MGRAMALFDKDLAARSITDLLDVKEVKDMRAVELAIIETVNKLREAKENESLNYDETSQQAMFNLFKVINKNNIQVPPQISKALRVVLTSDGVVTSLNPDLDMDTVAQDIFRVTLAATYMETKNSFNKDNFFRTGLKIVNWLEEEVFLG